MDYFLDTHSHKYDLTTAEAFSLLTTTAIPYALRHRELAQKQETNWLGHQVLFIAECIPVIGILVAAIEYLVAAYFRASTVPKKTPEPLNSGVSTTPIKPILPSPIKPPPSPTRPLIPEPTDVPSVNIEPTVDDTNVQLDIDPLRPISPSPKPLTTTPGTTETEEPIPPLPTNFSSSDSLLREAQDYYNHADIPVPLTFPEINVDGLSQNDLIEALLNKYNGLCIGEYHTHSSPKYFLTVNMPLFKRLGVDALYLEGYDGLQGELDAYFAGDSIEIPTALKTKICPFASPCLPGYYCEYDVLMGAKREGIRMVNIDCIFARNSDVAEPILLRDAKMNYYAKLIIDQDRAKHPTGKSIIYAGSAHTCRIAGLPGLGQMYQFPAINVEDMPINCSGADENLIPPYSLKKEFVTKTSYNRTMNSDFLIQMNKPLKA